MRVWFRPKSINLPGKLGQLARKLGTLASELRDTTRERWCMLHSAFVPTPIAARSAIRTSTPPPSTRTLGRTTGSQGEITEILCSWSAMAVGPRSPVALASASSRKTRYCGGDWIAGALLQTLRKGNVSIPIVYQFSGYIYIEIYRFVLWVTVPVRVGGID
jgi:hypothetical protein